jgi:hypothetical protein
MALTITNPERIVILVAADYSNATDVASPPGTFTPTTMDGPFTISGITNANPMVVTIGAHALQFGRQVFIEGVTGTTAANGYFLVIAFTATTISLGTNVSSGAPGNGAYVSGGTMTVVNSATAGHPGAVGEGVQERDMIAFNAGVIPGGSGSGGGRVSYAF